MIPAAALAPVTERLRRDAEAEAERIRSAARAEAASILDQAHLDAAGAVARAEETAAATAAPVAAAELRRARDQARAAVLSAQREAQEELGRQVRAAVAALAEDAGYERLISQVERLAATAAGPGAQLSRPARGGVVAQSPGVLVDCSLDRLADLAVAQLGADIRLLWSP
jgi:vacuolar-type H+-ATPase subunit E/Vma4